MLTPDLEAGGYTVEVPELPGCRTEGDDLAEARRMTEDAIDAWLSVNAPRSGQRQGPRQVTRRVGRMARRASRTRG